MRARLGLALSLCAAAGLHALFFLIPLPGEEETASIATVEITIASEPAGAPGGDARLAAAVERHDAATPAPGAPAPVGAREQAPETMEQPGSAVPAHEVPAPVAPQEHAMEMAATGSTAADAPVAAGGDSAQPAKAQPSATTDPNGTGQGMSSMQAGPDVSAHAGGGLLFGAGTGTGGAGTAGAGTDRTIPRPLADIHPAYPRAARRAGWEGIVRISALVDDTGVVVSAEIMASSGHPVLDQAALDAVRLTVFTPARQSGKAIVCRVIIPIRFQLN
jgi:periplasmic protein TonB